MALLSRLKHLLGLGTSAPETGGTTITVERQPSAEAARAVEEPVSQTTTADDPDEAASEAAEPADGQTEDSAPDAGDEGGADVDGAGAPVTSISGIGPAYADRLAKAGVETVDDLAAADASALDEDTEIGVGRLTDWIERANAS